MERVKKAFLFGCKAGLLSLITALPLALSRRLGHHLKKEADKNKFSKPQ